MTVTRTKKIIRVSLTGIAANLLLTAIKAAAGAVSNSTAVILDAVNNLSDALSSTITMIGTRIAGREADTEHPYGHGRVEYITSSVTALTVMAAGLASLREAVSKIITPSEVRYSAALLTVMIVSIAAKLFLGRNFLKKGRELVSSSLTASGTDALGDAVISAATLVSAAAYIFTGIYLEGWVGAAISVFIFRSGLDILSEAVDNIIGIRTDKELSESIRKKLCSYEGVLGAYDLVCSSYGPGRSIGSVHIELSDKTTIRELDSLTRRIVPEIYKESGVILTIGAYASNTYDESSRRIKEAVRRETEALPKILQIHGFHTDSAEKAVYFDVFFAHEENAAPLLIEMLKKRLTEQFPEYTFHITIVLSNN